MVPSRRTYLWTGLALGAFVIYGSLVPFAFQAMSADGFSAGLMTMLTSPSGRSLSDVAVNVLLVVPLAFAMCGAFCLDRPGFDALLWGSVYAAAVCLLVSLAAEVGQIFIQDRTPSLGDVAAQLVGSAAGIGLWWTSGPALTRYLRKILAARGHAHLFTTLLAAYAAIWCLRQWLPLDLTIRPSELLQKYREGRLTLSLVAPGPLDAAHLTGWMVHALGAAPVGALSALLWTRHNRMRGAGLAAVLGVIAVTAVEVLQVFVFSRSSQTFDALVASCGAVVGVLGAHALGPGLGFDCGAAAARAAATRVRAALAVWIGLLIVYHWSPFDFTADAGAVAERWAALSLVPFVNYEAISAFVALDDLVTKMLLACPVGLMAGMLVSARGRRGAPDAAGPVLAAGVLFLLIEMGQLCLRSRVPDVTDVLTQAAAAAAGVWLAFRQPPPVVPADGGGPSWGRPPAGPGPGGRQAGPSRPGGSSGLNPDFRPRSGGTRPGPA